MKFRLAASAALREGVTDWRQQDVTRVLEQDGALSRSTTFLTPTQLEGDNDSNSGSVDGNSIGPAKKAQSVWSPAAPSPTAEDDDSASSDAESVPGSQDADGMSRVNSWLVVNFGSEPQAWVDKLQNESAQFPGDVDERLLAFVQVAAGAALEGLVCASVHGRHA